MIAVDKEWKTNSWKTNQAEFFLLSTSLQILANKPGCVQTNLLFIFFLYTTSEEKEYYEALFLSYRPRTKCSISQFFKTNCIYSIFRTIVAQCRVNFWLAKPFKKFPKSPIRPAGSNFWQALNLQRNSKELRFNMIKNLLCLFFY